MREMEKELSELRAKVEAQAVPVAWDSWLIRRCYEFVAGCVARPEVRALMPGIKDLEQLEQDLIAVGQKGPSAQAASVPANEFPHDEMDAIALHRFKVEQTDSNVWGWCVRAGDGTQELYKGRKSSCEAVARRLIGAFLDGAMLAHDMLAAAPSSTGLDNPEAPKS